MRPLGWVGVLLIVAGGLVAAMGGLPYTQSREVAEVGPLKVATREERVLPPVVGLAAIAIGAVLVVVSRKRTV